MHTCTLHYTLSFVVIPERGCPAAVVRVWPDLDKVPIELCGEGLTDDASLIISKSSLVRVAFLTADRAVGAKGFEGIWTEIQDSKLMFNI